MMAKAQKDKKTISLWGVICILVTSVWLLASVNEAKAETLTWKLVSMIENIEVVKVGSIEGVATGVYDRKGLSMFENGDIATTKCQGTFDTKEGFQGYSSLTFKDGSTIVVMYKGPTGGPPPSGKFKGFTDKPFKFVEGTGRFKGIKGSGTFSGKTALWDKDFSSKGFAYYEYIATYTLTP